GATPTQTSRIPVLLWHALTRSIAAALQACRAIDNRLLVIVRAAADSTAGAAAGQTGKRRARAWRAAFSGPPRCARLATKAVASAACLEACARSDAQRSFRGVTDAIGVSRVRSRAVPRLR